MRPTIKIVLIFILFLAGFFRFYRLDRYPPSLFSDEVDLGYQSYSFLKTGKDYHGNKFPISFHSFADFRAPLYLYTASITISLFGLNEWGVRLPAAIYGFLGVITLFLLIKQITKDDFLALLSAFVLAIMPWHLHYSRAGFEVTALFFYLTLGLFFFFRFIEKRKTFFLLLAVITLTICLYTYATARLFLPVLALSAVLIYRQSLFSLKLRKIIPIVFIGILVMLPLVKDTLTGGGLHRFSYLNIFSDPNLKFEIDRQRLVDTVHGRSQELGMQPPLFALFYHNKPFSWLKKMIENYLSGFSSGFLFLTGDPNLRHGVGKTGELLLIFLPFLVIGFFHLASIIKNQKKDLLSPPEAIFLLSFFLLAPLPASITYDGGTHATRLFLLVLPLSVFIGLGFRDFLGFFTLKKTKGLVAGFIFLLTLVNFLFYHHLYYFHYPLNSEKYWHAGFKSGIQKLMTEQENYDKVILTDTYEPPLIFFLFWSGFDPFRFNANLLTKKETSWFEGRQMGKYYFGRIGTGFVDTYLNNQIKNKKVEKILLLVGRNDLGGDLAKEVPAEFKVINKVYLPSQEPVFFLVRTKTIQEIEEETLLF